MKSFSNNPILQASANRRVQYDRIPDREPNLVLMIDSYKACHQFAYPEGQTSMFAYGTGRVSPDQFIVNATFQQFLMRYVAKPIQQWMIDEAETFLKSHGEPFDRSIWDYILNEFDGYIPIRIRAVPEGIPVPGGVPLYTVMCEDREIGKHIAWLAAYYETICLRGFWYGSTIATNGFNMKKTMANWYEMSDGDMNFLPFAQHDFGGRGTTCHEQACIGGMAHTYNWMGSDTIEGILYANHYGRSNMAAYSVWATEHSVECSFGLSPEQEIVYIKTQMLRAQKQGCKIVSIVGDGKDIYRFVNVIANELNEFVREMHEKYGMKLVVRLDSGDPMETVFMTLSALERGFGVTYTERGFKKLYPGVGILQGDGVDALLINSILGKMVSMSWSADNIVFGSGGALLQKVNRDTYKWAQKASSVIQNDEIIGVAKDPITDPGKKSLEGILTTVKNTVTGEIFALRIDDITELPENCIDLMEDVYDTGKLFNYQSLDQIRANLKIS